ncbi:MAG: energy transducer TonB [Chlorobiota bacterium]
MLLLLACTSLAEPPEVIQLIRHPEYDKYIAANKNKIVDLDSIKIKQNVSTDIDLIMKAVEYPEYAVENEIEGRVLVKVLVDDNDRVLSVQIHESDNEYLNKSALEAIYDTFFESAIDTNGRKIAGYIYMPIQFKLR